MIRRKAELTTRRIAPQDNRVRKFAGRKSSHSSDVISSSLDAHRTRKLHNKSTRLGDLKLLNRYDATLKINWKRGTCHAKLKSKMSTSRVTFKPRWLIACSHPNRSAHYIVASSPSSSNRSCSRWDPWEKFHRMIALRSLHNIQISIQVQREAAFARFFRGFSHQITRLDNCACMSSGV